MEQFIKAVEEMGFKETFREHYADFTHIHFKKKGVNLTLQVWADYTNIFTDKKTGDKEIEFNFFKITEPQIPSAIRAIVRFWSKNGVKLGEKK